MIVVGAGSAGFAAAVAAARAGAHVCVLEKSGAVGGNAAFSHTGFRAAYDGPDAIAPFVADLAGYELPGYSVADYAADLDRFGVPPALRDALAGDSYAALEWLRELGVRFTFNRSLHGRFEPGLVLAADGLVAAWERIAAAHDVDVWVDAPVERVVVDEGVLVGGVFMRADAVIVCSGGFQADAARRRRHLGTAGGVVRGSRHDTGELLEALIEDGAARAGGWGEAVITPVDAASPPAEGGNRMNRYSYPYGITVDAAGRRFFDEGSGLLADTYAVVGRLVLERGGAWQVFDAAGTRLLKRYAYDFATPRRADTVAGLGIDGLEETVRAFNAACPDGPFDPTRPDGRATIGLDPPKSHWAVPLREPPFRAYAVTGGVTFTLGGLAVDDGARVLGEDGAPLPGVFASGDVIGLFHGGYPSGAGQTRNVVFSRRAAASATGRA
ncbi:FAD-dependent oxidoreductase [Solirubrobacter sp. CPCC 204708]|uniref:FAD-dependent oxidoreductase n=1 Tax=Solirubrobacter deserti TaxID=2282478 RepID=A0ABT4RFA7_9ACTN|nr:FAD-dependent oxidoreductase [Solirubrobacter deserti]MBE2319484.1 FAD-dependent oxidoreductase [Solirubrobacter deserti]MDA0137229.1 FAD-dependent oxidoreductase [Solirubrobacter deserti]